MVAWAALQAVASAVITMASRAASITWGVPDILLHCEAKADSSHSLKRALQSRGCIECSAHGAYAPPKTLLCRIC